MPRRRRRSRTCRVHGPRSAPPRPGGRRRAHHARRLARAARTASASPTPTRAVTSAAASASAAASGALSEAPELEALLPDTIAGEQTQKLSMKGATLMAGRRGGQLLHRLPRSARRAARRMSRSPSPPRSRPTARRSPTAWRGPRRRTCCASSRARSAASEGGSDITWETATVGGRHVQRGTSSSTRQDDLPAPPRRHDLRRRDRRSRHRRRDPRAPAVIGRRALW